MNASDIKKVEVYNRNKEKFSNATNKFKDETHKLGNMLDLVRSKCDLIINQICVKFTKDIEGQFFDEMN